MSTFVLDASGLLAYLQDEDGGSEVEEALAQTGTIGTVNLAEALSTVALHGADPRQVIGELEARGILGGLLEVEPLTTDDAIAIAELRPPTKDRGLSLGDRACLALGMRLGLPVMTADRAWSELESVIDGVQIYSIRS
ncbi:MAG: type II toxin-antitoxin system VapC family toxin [Actinobacteria bacterium]|nr:type II toxin-antitoxin system VapC family toxin [Actinomycetota bacterium]